MERLFDEKQRSFTSSTSKLSPPMPSSRTEQHGVVFWVAVGLSQIAALACIVLVIYWVRQYGGFDWSDKDLMFNYHPLFMVLGLIVFYGDAIIVYRALHFLPKSMLKIIHGGLHVCAIVLSTVALIAVFENHRKTNKDDLYSIHSWIGITAFTAFCLQYIGGFVTFLYPGLPPNWRTKVMAYHTFFGLGIFIMAAAAAGMGITEKLLWTENYSKLMTTGLLGNILGLMILVFVFLIAFITTHSSYKRRPRSDELPSATLN